MMDAKWNVEVEVTQPDCGIVALSKGYTMVRCRRYI